MTDPLMRLARERALVRRIADSADIELQFSAAPGGRPVVAMLRKAMLDACEAMVALAVAEPTDAKLILALQNRILRFDDLVKFARDIINEGEEADQELTGAEREELLAYLTETEEGRTEAEDLGLIEREVNDA